MPTEAECAPAVHLTLDGLSGPVAFDAGTEAVAGGLRDVLVGWPECRGPASGEPCLVVRRQGETILVTRCRDDWCSQHQSVVSAVRTAVAEIVADHVDHGKGLGSLHAAAAEFAGRLVVFPAVHGAGRSTLMTALSARGRRIFADDLLPVDLQTLEGVATGCLPRLRLPLTAAVPAGLAAFVAAHTVSSDRHYAYVAGGRPVAHGERAPIGAVVLLDRRSEPRAAHLDPTEPDEGLLGLLMQDARDAFPADRTLERYHELVSKSALHRLTYPDLGEAIACLNVAFSSWREPTDSRHRRGPSKAA